MSGQNLLIRADASPQIGSGHFMRCLALAQAHQAHGGHAIFLSACEGDALRQRVLFAGIVFIPLEKENPHSSDLGITLAQLEQLDNPWLVIDGYHFDPAYQQKIRAAGYRLLVVDDTACWLQYHANVLLNQNINADQLDYRCGPETLLLLGTRYALLRPEFLAWQGWQRKIPDVAHRVLVTMGGSDLDNVTLRVVEGLRLVDLDDLEALIVVGSANPHLEIMQQSVEHCTHDIRLLTDVTDMPELMAWADVAVSAGGSTCWELAFMGLPTIALVLAENQRDVAEGLQEAGAAVNLGWHERVDADRIASEVAALCRDPDQRRELSQNSHRLVDGRGTERLLDVMAGLESAPSGNAPFQIRPATRDDALQLWQLANDPVVRENSFNPRHIPLDHHMAWYESKLSSPHTRMWVFELAEAVVAQIRYDRVTLDTAEIGFSVAPAFRGRGLGTKMLQQTWERACDELEVERVQGMVHKSNAPSARAFLNSGFDLVREDMVHGRPCHIFERECCREDE